MRYLLIILLLTGCYNSRKAKQQFSKAIIYDQKIGADFCAIVYPPKDTIIRDTTTTTDTIYVEGAERLDTITVNDTVRITRTITLPGKVITNTIHVTDTIYRENTAALKACQVDNTRLIASTGVLTAERDKGRAGRDKWRLIALISLAVNGIGLYLKIRKIV